MSRKKTYTVSTRLNEEQYKFLENWKKDLENELGIDIPLGALLRRAVDFAAKHENTPRFSGFGRFAQGLDPQIREEFLQKIHSVEFNKNPSKLREHLYQWLKEEN